ncbi:MAG: metal ABC transporter permease [Spartobacteria bacterium]|nr:metal ABC transporter permease [Spartobacteria bacterium]
MMDVLEQVFGSGFGQRALLAAVMIGFLNGYLGGYVVIRRSALFAGALSHTIFPGIALGALIAGLNPVSALLGAGVTAMLVGLGATGVSASSRLDRDSALAILFTAAFGAGLIILRRLSTYVSLEDYLFGNILAVSNADLWFVFAAGGITLSILILLQRPLLIYLFSEVIARTQGIPVHLLAYLLAALIVLTMIISLQAVGAILTLGLLIAPASIMYLYVDSPRVILWGGGLLGTAVSVLCVIASYAFNTQTGPLIVVSLGLLFVLAYVCSPKYGLVFRIFKYYHMRQDPDA